MTVPPALVGGDGEIDATQPVGTVPGDVGGVGVVPDGTQVNTCAVESKSKRTQFGSDSVIDAPCAGAKPAPTK